MVGTCSIESDQFDRVRRDLRLGTHDHLSQECVAIPDHDVQWLGALHGLGSVVLHQLACIQPPILAIPTPSWLSIVEIGL